jgi:hypothetical protein
MNDLTLHDRLNAAIEQWVLLTGIDPETPTYKIGGDGVSSWDVKKSYDALNDAQELDETGLTTAMLLRSYIHWFSENINFTAKSILDNPSNMEIKIRQFKDLYALMNTDEIRTPTQDFIETLRMGVSHYPIKKTNDAGEELEDFLQDEMVLAFIRRDALAAVKKLECLQFTRGEASANQDWGYSPTIHQLWSINNLLAAISEQNKDGVTLSLIRDPDGADYSYFCFGIRNGGNIYVMTDRPQFAHPHQKFMSRSKARQHQFEDRAFTYHFPYQLLDYAYDEETGNITFNRQEGLILQNQTTIPLGKLFDLKPAQIIWLVMVLAKIKTNILIPNEQLPELSYTAAMLQQPEALGLLTNSLPVKYEGALELPLYTGNDVNTNNMSGQWDRPSSGHFLWMEERYGGNIDPTELNILGGRLKHNRGSSLSYRHEAYTWNRVTKVENHYTGELSIPDRSVSISNRSFLDLRDFGSKDHLEHNAKWHARFNKVNIIQERANKEFEECKDEIIDWWKTKVESNSSAILDSVYRMSFVSSDQISQKSFDFSTESLENILKLKMGEDNRIPYGWWSIEHTYVYIGTHDRSAKWFCPITGTKAQIFAQITPKTPKALADLCGVAVEELPFFLQKYYTHYPYVGNSILNSLDPLDYHLHNPWSNLKLGVIISLSKKAFQQGRKSLGLPRITDWEQIGKKD